MHNVWLGGVNKNLSSGPSFGLPDHCDQVGYESACYENYLKTEMQFKN